MAPAVMNTAEFEMFLAEAIEGYADVTDAPVTRVRTFRQAGIQVLTTSGRGVHVHGLVVNVGQAEFHIVVAGAWQPDRQVS